MTPVDIGQLERDVKMLKGPIIKKQVRVTGH